MSIIIGVKFCGHCNPQREGQLVLRDLLTVIPDLEIRSWSDSGCDVILVVSACPVGCASHPDTDRPIISVAVEQVRTWNVPQMNRANQLLTVFSDFGYEFVSKESPRSL